MTQVTEMGAIVMPPVPAFYTRPATVDDIVDHSVGRALDLFGIDTGRMKLWGEEINIGAGRKVSMPLSDALVTTRTRSPAG
jgi:4-hydroxy-3-polyprenylbenzoate decarboxylase